MNHAFSALKRQRGVNSDLRRSDSENLTETVSEERNWKSIAVALLVIVIICTLIIIAIVLTTPKPEEKYFGRQLTFDEVFNASFQTYDLRPQWVGDVLFYRARNGQLMSIDPATGDRNVLLDARYFNDKSVADYTVSSNLKYIALKWNVMPRFRYSSESFYTVYNLETQISMKVVPPGFPSNADVPLQLFQWTKSNRSDALIFVYANNIYYKASAFATSATQITFTGVPNRVFNAIPDWIYEEEIIAAASTVWWSRNGSLIAYTQINDTQCTFFDMPRYNNVSQVYPVTDKIAYPKAGETRENNIPAVTILVHNLDTNTPLGAFHAPDEFLANTNYLFTGAVWFDDDALLIEWANREQSKSVALICTISTATCRQSLQNTAIPIDSSDDVLMKLSGWVDTESRRFYPVAPTKEQNYPYITTVLHTTQPPKPADVRRQVSFVGGITRESNALPRVTPLTLDSEVDEVLAVDSVKRIVYYIAPRDDDPKTAHLFAVGWTDKVEGAERVQKAKCLTCALNATCDVVYARFSASANYYLLMCNGPSIPFVALRNTNDANADEFVLEDNEPLRKLLEVVMMPRISYQQLEVEDGRKLDVELMLPPSLNEMHFIVHPLLVYVYAGPDSRSVMKRWKAIGWLHYMVTVHNVVVVAIDGRGTSGRGRRNAYWLHKSLGTHEIRDQILAVQALKKLSYVDKAKIAIQGSSYGGYAALHVLANASDIVPCGISLAPVTDWQFYDTAYTERYMGRYKDHVLQYNKGSLLQRTKIEGLKRGVLLLAHGTADDNVHLQHSLQLIKLLNEAEAQFDLHIYTDRAHNLRGGPAGRQLTQKMINFLLDCYSNKTAARIAPEGFSKFEDEGDA